MVVLRYFLNRIPRLLIVFFGVSIITFAISHVIPGDPARMLVGQRASQETLDKMRGELGLDKPLHVQYIKYVGDLLQGDMGKSIRTQQPIASELKRYFPATLELTLVSMLITLIAGVLLGVWAAVKRDRWVDHISRIVSLVGVSNPLFWSGLVVMVVFYKWLQLFPASGRLNPFISPPTFYTGMYLVDGFLDGNMAVVGNAVQHLVLPAGCLAYVQLAVIARQVRSSMIEVLSQDYIRTAKSFGLSTRKIIYHYALKNALLPTVTVAGLIFGELLGGAIITEAIFGWPGMGKYVVDSVTFLDFPAIMGFTMVVSFGYVIINLLIDLLYRVLDPQIREGG
ncbi:putative D,D-dipeptide transport system permease protein DdpB [Propionispora sp. 2/2-37]|uniref:ABC transporter permease n=1 Tax=Propionispora sp. 2/2-37 TaxID=1677858 RepID=UPI0006BB6959|nr:ABC transporter permease [Propionispora sp. 2/2-37]CUH95808.1 putative D,D-dipeptide transport system permease protein DdpB [Propionispora sp. 2/2-37]